MSILLTFVLSIIMMTATAFALTRSDPYETPPIHGHIYSFTSEVWNRTISDVSTVEAVAPVGTDENVPVGYMGANARLYNSSAKLVTSSGLVYNTSTISAFYVYSPRISTPGQYYAQCIDSFYNGNGYDDFIGYESPIQTLSSSNSASITNVDKILEEIRSQTEYAKNDNGETYGSALSADTIGTEPDLIAAVGTNGINGYVRAKELTPKVSTIEEALAQMGENGSIRTIPVYDVDGTTVLGQFDIVTNYELVTDTE